MRQDRIKRSRLCNDHIGSLHPHCLPPEPSGSAELHLEHDKVLQQALAGDVLGQAVPAPTPISAAHVLGSHAEFCTGNQNLDGSGRGGDRG